MYIHNYYRIKNRISEARSWHNKQGYKAFCSLCFKPKGFCDHNVGYDEYNDVLPQLNWWLEICEGHALDRGLGVMVDGSLVPLWTLGYEEEEIEYTSYPKVGEIFGLLPDGRVINSVGVIVSSCDEKSQGVVSWGHFIDDEFLSIATFTEDGLWKLEDVEGEAEKEWLVPHVKKNYKFRVVLK